MKAIVYTSNTGHTRQYAELASRLLDIPAYDLKQALKELPKDSEVIYMGWLMAGRVKGYDKASKYFSVKALCGVGMAATGSQIGDIRKANATGEEMPVFSLQGGFELSKLHGIYKLMMSMMKNTAGKKLASKQNRTAEEEDMLDLMMNGGNRVSEQNLAELLDWYRTV